MRILHYTLGYPPHRRGGLVKYASDLMEEERKMGHAVYTLYPGNFSLFSRISLLKKESERVYVLTNGLPISLMYGIDNPYDFIAPREIVGFNEFISIVKPDVFHVHTLMGLPKELLSLMKQSGVRIVYTSHDYFGLCPKVNFINDRGDVCEGASEDRCLECCKNAHGRLFLKIRNSKFVDPLKKILR